MTELADFLTDAWRDGVGPDDRMRIARLLARADLAADPALPEAKLFAAWFDLLGDVRAEVPAVGGDDGALAVVRAAACVYAAKLAREPARLDAAVADLADALGALDEDDESERAHAAQAWTDVALAAVAAMIGDVPTARRRYEAVAEIGNPSALRLHAMLALAALALQRVDVGPARQWAKKAHALAEHAKRPEHLLRATLLLGMLDYVAGDSAAMRKALEPLAKDSVLARILLASVEKASRALPLLADGLREATERADPLAYTLCILVGARRYAAIGRDGDALVTISAGMAQVRAVAPFLAGVLADERGTWQRDWPAARWAAAEKAALALLESA
ncbi:MAG TPA: hypothetical protein VMJ10_01380 [Kofleriaceae bacterium]|nr:hypothetical protein [Kofleriaceae bacterium]